MVSKMEILKKIKAKEWLIFLGLLFLFLYLDYFVIALYYTTGTDLHELSTLDKLIILFAKYIILAIIFIIKDHKYLKEKWYDFKNNFIKYFKISTKNWFMGFLIMFVSNILISQFVTGIGENEETVQTLISSVPVEAFILVTFCAPFIEEMVFRKYLKDCVDHRVLYMVLSGFIFGLIHTSFETNILELLLIIPYGGLGFMFAKTINETDNIYATILLHMLHNGVLTLIAIGGI
jgi:membrane protease YdiL (CAAX protease family)